MKRFFFFFLMILVLHACTSSDQEKIERLLVQRAEAFQNKNLALYLSCISKDYQDKEENFEKLKNRVSGYFETFDRIDYSAWDRSIQVEGKDATTLQQFRIEVEKKGNKNQYAGREMLHLRKEGGEWKIVSGL
jgi:ketosteroid isomerase-like protein